MTVGLAESRRAERVSERRFTFLLVLTWCGAVIPLLVASLLGTKYRTGVGEQLIANTVAVQVQRFFAVVLLAWCLFVVLARIRNLPTDRWVLLAVLLAPWLCMVSRDLYNDRPPTQLVKLLYPALVVAVWILRPQLARLSLLAYLVGLTALIDIALALVMPTRGLFTSVTGEFITPEKQILPWGILVGVFSGGNVAAQFLVAAFPTVALVRKGTHRFWLTVLIGCTLVWTSSRTSLAAFAVALLVFAAVALLPPQGRAAVALFGVLALGATMVLTPLLTTTYAAFTNRGYIWQMSLAAWDVNRTFGLGSDWYSRIGRFMNDLPSTAFHGHNLLLHSLVIGGYLYVSLMLVLMLALLLAAVRWAFRGVSFPAAMMAAAMVSSTLEVPFGVIDRSVMYVVVALPFAVILFAAVPPRPDESRPGLTGEPGLVEADGVPVDAFDPEDLLDGPLRGAEERLEPVR